MNKNFRNISIGAAVIVVSMLLLFSIVNAFNDNSSVNDDNEIMMSYDTPDIIDGYQQVTLYFINYEYKLVPENLLVGVPVKMTVDLETVYGCMRAVMIPAFNVRKFVNENDNIILFTPDRTGNFNILCTMNMGRGTFRVVEG
ncbi:MAG: hypothetical protein ACMXYL_03985 [Candidatus Woesearchaeota archaeon]